MGIGANSVFALENEKVITAPGDRGAVGAFPKVERPGTAFPKVERPGAEFPKQGPPTYDTHK
ncbi:MAG TPA: hypothetical protein ENN98_07060 [Desulfurivibrio alkaliphilus]|uniref:Uncharacterized protein n=1 Tax=Desulfurivibrio alkaliphilus TaxID=427923 RepID=A0A7C2XAN0_9BACT|nr:hypothetical protein [Desulfurivibrio alkaliphilus]